MKVKRERIAKWDIMGHLLLAAIVQSFENKEEKDKFFKEIDYANKEEIEVCLTFEGKEFDIEKVCRNWDLERERMINKRALGLIKDRFCESGNVLHGIIDDLVKELIRRARADLGVEISEDE